MSRPTIGLVAIGRPGRAALEIPPSLSGPVGSPADTVLDGVDLSPLILRAASVRGLGHRDDGTPRQDAYAIARSTAGAWLLVAVADGVSQSPESHRAADTASRAAIAALDRALADATAWALDWAQIVAAASKAVLDAARSHTGDPELDEAGARELMATTLLIAAISVDPLGSGVRGVYLASVGDCTAILLDSFGRWWPVSAIKGFTDGVENEIQSSAVHPLPDVNPIIEVQSVELRPGDAVFLVSDGIGDALGMGTNTVAIELADWWASPPAPIDFAAHVGFARQSFTDDRTAVGVWVATEDASVPDGPIDFPLAVE